MTPGLLLPSDPKSLSNTAIFNPVWLVIGGGLILAALLYSLVPDTRPGHKSSA